MAPRGYSPNNPRGQSDRYRDPYGRPKEGAGFGRGDGRPATSSATKMLEERYGPLGDYSDAYFTGGREYWNETNYNVNPDGSVSQIVPGRESRNPFDSGYDQAMFEMVAQFPQTSPDVPSSAGSSGAGYGDMQAMIDAIVQSGLLNRPSAKYDAPQMFDPTLVDTASLQMVEPTLMDASQLQQFTPEELTYMDFDPMRQNLQRVADQTGQMIDDAYAPLAALREPLQTSSGMINPAATQLDAELANLASAMGVGDAYGGQVDAANADILQGATAFTDRGAMLDRVFNERRQGVADAGEASRAAAQANRAMEKMLSSAGIDMSQAQDVQRVDNANVGSRNAANEAWTNLVNSIAMGNNQLLNQADSQNAGILNDALLTNIGLQNDAGMANTNALNDVNRANVDLENMDQQSLTALLMELIAAGAGMGQTLDLSGLVA